MALIRVWRLAGMPSGKYLAATMDLWLPKLEAYGELKSVRFSPEVREQLMTVSGVTTDRLLNPTREGMAPRGLSATKAVSELRSAIAVRRAGQEHEQIPGFLEADLVAHWGPALVGGIRPHAHRHRCVHRLDGEGRDPQQRLQIDPRSDGNRRGASAVPAHWFGHR